MTNNIKATYEGGYCGSLSSLTNTPFIGGVHGAVLMRNPTILSGGGCKSPRPRGSIGCLTLTEIGRVLGKLG